MTSIPSAIVSTSSVSATLPFHEHETAGDAWPRLLWPWAIATGMPRWTIPRQWGGDGRSSGEVLRLCQDVARRHLGLALVLSQFQAAISRIVELAPQRLQERWLPQFASGAAFTTVGISQLTTSRQHQGHPAVRIEKASAGQIWSGEAPWVTAGIHADVLLLGGTLADGRQMLALVPRDRAGLTIEPPVRLLALEESATGGVKLDRVLVMEADIVAGPAEKILAAKGGGSGAGSLMTSALAIGHGQAILDRLKEEAAKRPGLDDVVGALEEESQQLAEGLGRLAEGHADEHLNAETLRAASTSLALRGSQTLIAASKGAGFVVGHPAERLAREALFFLVWSCPQTVTQRLLQEFGRCEE